MTLIELSCENQNDLIAHDNCKPLDCAIGTPGCLQLPNLLEIYFQLNLVSENKFNWLFQRLYKQLELHFDFERLGIQLQGPQLLQNMFFRTFGISQVCGSVSVINILVKDQHFLLIIMHNMFSADIGGNQSNNG